jgi:hypothetical protein
MRDEVKLIIFSVVIFAAAYFSSFLFDLPLALLLLLTFYFTCFSYILNSLLQKAVNDENKNKFTQVFLGLTGIKILSSLILLVCFLYMFKGNKLHIGICTMGYYMLYTVFEVTLWKAKLKS